MTATSKKVSSRGGGKRELMNVGTDNRFVRRSASGRLTESDDAGRSLPSDRRRYTKDVPKAGQGNSGDRKGGTRGATASTVPEILKQIDSLSEDDRLLLERRLAERAEAKWLRETQAARELARARGIDQAAIDRAVEEVRYPQRPNGDRR